MDFCNNFGVTICHNPSFSQKDNITDGLFSPFFAVMDKDRFSKE